MTRKTYYCLRMIMRRVLEAVHLITPFATRNRLNLILDGFRDMSRLRRRKKIYYAGNHVQFFA